MEHSFDENGVDNEPAAGLQPIMRQLDNLSGVAPAPTYNYTVNRRKGWQHVLCFAKNHLRVYTEPLQILSCEVNRALVKVDRVYTAFGLEAQFYCDASAAASHIYCGMSFLYPRLAQRYSADILFGNRDVFAPLKQFVGNARRTIFPQCR